MQFENDGTYEMLTEGKNYQVYRRDHQLILVDKRTNEIVQPKPLDRLKGRGRATFRRRVTDAVANKQLNGHLSHEQ